MVYNYRYVLQEQCKLLVHSQRHFAHTLYNVSALKGALRTCSVHCQWNQRGKVRAVYTVKAQCKCNVHRGCNHRSTVKVHCTPLTSSAYCKCTQRCNMYFEYTLSMDLQLNCTPSWYTVNALNGALFMWSVYCSCNYRCTCTYKYWVHIQCTLWINFAMSYVYILHSVGVHICAYYNRIVHL